MNSRRYTVTRCLVLSLLCASIGSAYAEPPRFSGGHIKYQLRANQLAEDNLLLDSTPNPLFDNNAETRLKFDWQGEHLSLQADYQLISLRGDRVSLYKRLSGQVALPNPQISDERRYFDLTRVISEQDEGVLLHRLDRLAFEYTGDRVVTRLGRQAISWGNGLIYTPMDIFNPFDPAAVDKEYKTGDDMAYGQLLFDRGDDLQAVWVARRDASGESGQAVNSTAVKYHGFAATSEYDLLVAEHYDDAILGVGGVLSAGGAILRGDLTVTDTPSETVTSLVANLSYSWITGGHNVSGILEYFFNGFGQPAGQYSPAELANNPDLVKRYARGELFTLGRQYIAASALIEVTPLWRLTPNVFVNMSDQSALLQFVSNYDFKQDWQLLVALTLPVGPTGTEFGGIDSGVAGKTLSTGPGVFMQLAWYF